MNKQERMPYQALQGEKYDKVKEILIKLHSHESNKQYFNLI